MAGRFDTFSLQELIAKPEDAFRLATLAADQGRELRAYGGSYYRYDLGDARLSVRAAKNYETGELELCGMDIALRDAPLWELTAVGDLTDPGADTLSRTLLLRRSDGEGLFAAALVNADVLPRFEGPVRLGVSGQAVRVDYYPEGTPPSDRLPDGVLVPCGYLLATQSARAAASLMDPLTDADFDLTLSTVQLRGVVKDAQVGETYMGLEQMTVFVRIRVETIYGDLDICHPTAMVAEDQRDLVKPGSVVSVLCELTADAAVGRYEGGIEFGEEQDLALLRQFFEHGGADRLRPALHGECEYLSEYSGSRLDGVEATIALLKDVEAALDEESRYFAYPAHILRVQEDPSQAEPAAYGPGKAFLLLAQGGPERYVALCFIETDSLGRIKTIYLSRDGRYIFQRDDLELTGAEAPADALEAMLPWMVAGGLIGETKQLLADTSAFPAYERRAQEALEEALGREDPEETNREDLDETLRALFGTLYAETAGGEGEKGAALYEGFLNYPRLAKPDPAAYRQQLLNALVFVQRLGALNRL